MDCRSFVILLVCIVACVSRTEAHKGRHGHPPPPPPQFVAPLIGGRGHSHDHRHGSLDHAPGVGELTDAQIMEKIKGFTNQESTKELVQFLTALNGTEGQKMLQYAGLQPTMIQDLLKLLQGSPSDILKAKQQINSFTNSLQMMSQRDRMALRKIYGVYVSYMNRQMAQQMIQSASLEALTAGLTALAQAEQQLWFRGIMFSDLLKTLKEKGAAGRQEIIDKLVNWVKMADCNSLKRAGMIIGPVMKPFMPTTTLPPTGSTLPASTTLPPTGSTLPASTTSSSSSSSSSSASSSTTSAMPTSSTPAPRPE